MPWPWNSAPRPRTWPAPATHTPPAPRPCARRRWASRGGPCRPDEARGVEARHARSDELGACADLYVRVLSETFTWLPPDRHSREDFLRAAKEEEVYVAIEKGRVLGLAAFFRPQNFLHSLYVDDRCAGIGKALLDHVAAEADGPLSLKVQAP